MLMSKQKLFVENYLISHNATEAAKLAGYAEKSAEVTGSKLLRNAKVKAKISKNYTYLGTHRKKFQLN